MKKYFLLTIIIIFCVFSTACRSNTDDNILFEADSSAFEDSLNTENNDLFRTISGECYHNNGCRYLKSKVRVTYEEAINMGLRPCLICKPEFEDD